MTRPRGLLPTFPTRHDKEILWASAPGLSEATGHWQRWLAEADLNDVDAASFGLLPLVYQNLARENYSGRELGKLKGIYRQAWYRTRLIEQLTEQLMGELGDEAHPILFGDPAVARWAVTKTVGRPVDSAKVLVPAGRVIPVLDRACQLGWTLSNGDYPDLELHGSKALVRDGGLKVGIHWYLGGRHAYAGPDDPYWISAVGGWRGDPHLKTLSAADQLLSTLMLGFEPPPELALRWIVDALALIGQAGERVDWDRLSVRAEDMGQALAVADTLRVLSAFAPEQIPSIVIGRLGDSPLTTKAAHWVRRRSLPSYPWRRIPASWLGYRHRRVAVGQRANPVAFARSLIAGRKAVSSSSANGSRGRTANHPGPDA